MGAADRQRFRDPPVTRATLPVNPNGISIPILLPASSAFPCVISVAAPSPSAVFGNDGKIGNNFVARRCERLLALSLNERKKLMKFNMLWLICPLGSTLGNQRFPVYAGLRTMISYFGE